MACPMLKAFSASSEGVVAYSIVVLAKSARTIVSLPVSGRRRCMEKKVAACCHLGAERPYSVNRHREFAYFVRVPFDEDSFAFINPHSLSSLGENLRKYSGRSNWVLQFSSDENMNPVSLWARSQTAIAKVAGNEVKAIVSQIKQLLSVEMIIQVIG